MQVAHRVEDEQTDKQRSGQPIGNQAFAVHLKILQRVNRPHQERKEVQREDETARCSEVAKVILAWDVFPDALLVSCVLNDTLLDIRVKSPSVEVAGKEERGKDHDRTHNGSNESVVVHGSVDRYRYCHK